MIDPFSTVLFFGMVIGIMSFFLLFQEPTFIFHTGTIRATILLETITAAYEMEEILYEIRDHSLGLNCGRWDYLFSYIKKFKCHPDKVTPDRKHLTMETPLMQAYVKRLIYICHKRGTFAMVSSSFRVSEMQL